MKKSFSILYTAIAAGMVSCAGSGNKQAVEDCSASNAAAEAHETIHYRTKG